MKKVLLFTLFVAFLAACSQPKKKLTSGLNLANMDTTVAPGDDFANYVNGTWAKSAVIPDDKSSIGSFRTLHEKSQADVKAIIEEAAKGNNAVGTDEQKVGDLYASYMNMDKRNEIGIAPLKPEFEKIDGINNYDDLNSYFGYADKNGFGSPIGVMIEADFKEPTKYALYFWQAGLGLPEREYYLQSDEKSKELLAKYSDHISKMFSLAELPDGKKAAKTVLDIETNIAKIHLEKEKTRDMVAMYNKYEVEKLPSIMPKFNFEKYFAELGIQKLDYVIVSQVNFAKNLDKLIRKTSLKNWKTYLKWNVINASAGRLNDAMDKQNFAFYGTVLRGTKEQEPQWRRAVSVVNRTLGEVVGKVYVKKYFPPEAKQRMQTLVQNLLKAYEVSIKELDWMGEETKKQALDKLSKFTPKIGYPDKWKDYSALTINKDDLYGNLHRSAIVEHEREIKKIGQPIQKWEWGMTPQTVNAYYNPPQNEIVFPAAILQPPFFDMNAEDAVNYGGIGAVIGHEIGHGFDDQGSRFDGDGVLRNWWTENDNKEFAKRTSKLVDQYNAFKVFDDLNVNGDFTLGENIGDLGGLSIALKAYKISLNGKEAPVMDKFTGEQRVLLGWAQVWQKKTREEALRVQVKSDPHSPARFRINGVVRNVPEFYSAFNVTKENALYLPPEERVKIW